MFISCNRSRNMSRKHQKSKIVTYYFQKSINCTFTINTSKCSINFINYLHESRWHIKIEAALCTPHKKTKFTTQLGLMSPIRDFIWIASKILACRVVATRSSLALIYKNITLVSQKKKFLKDYTWIYWETYWRHAHYSKWLRTHNYHGIKM